MAMLLSHAEWWRQYGWHAVHRPSMVLVMQARLLPPSFPILAA